METSESVIDDDQRTRAISSLFSSINSFWNQDAPVNRLQEPQNRVRVDTHKMVCLLARQPAETVAIGIVYDTLSTRPYLQIMVYSNARHPDKEWIIENSKIQAEHC